MRLQFFGASARDNDNRQAETSRLVNCYREPTDSGHVVKADLGLDDFAALSGIFVRALGVVDGLLYASCGSRLQEVSTSGVVTDRGAVTDSATATIAGNNGVVTLVTAGAYYTWDGVSLLNPPAGAFSSFGAVTTIGNYTVLTELNGRRFQWSDFADAADLPGLNFSTADGRDDDLLRPVAINGVLYLFKEHSHEVWYLTGDAGADAFQRQAGGVYDTGLKAFGLLCELDGSAFFVGDDGRAHIVGIGPVSIPAVETAIKTLGPLKCLTWADEGHTMCAITFSGGPAWVYDLATGEWHERAQDVGLDPWEASVSAYFNGDWYLGRDGGDILKLVRSNEDAGIPLARVMVSRTLKGDGGYIRLNEVEIYPRIGFDAATVELRLSKDHGHTWSAPRPRSWEAGEYDKRIRWTGLGVSRQWTAEIRITDAVEVPVNGEGRVG